MTTRIAVAMTCHNRREKTLACLAALRRQRGHDAVLVPYVVDDGSTDGTAEAVAGRHPEAIVIHGDGGLFWAPGMARALEEAAKGDYDFYLWMNDDTILDDDAVATLLRTGGELAARGEPPSIVVGATRDPDTGALTYGGRHRPSRLRRNHFVLVEAMDEPRPVETMNGNVVLVPDEVVQRIGHIDGGPGGFSHSYADEDYGLRARANGCGVWTAPGTVATCPRNPAAVYGRAPLLQELRGLTAKTWPGMQPRDWALLMRRWAGPLWPVYFASPYLRRGLRITAAHLRRG